MICILFRWPSNSPYVSAEWENQDVFVRRKNQSSFDDDVDEGYLTGLGSKLIEGIKAGF